MDTSGMNGLGLASRIGRISDFNKMQEWKRAVGDFTTTSSINKISVTTSSQSSGSTMVPINQEDEEELDDPPEEPLCLGC